MEEESVPVLSRKELRKQKLMEYLAAKGNLKVANPKPYLQKERLGKEPVKSAPKVVTGKENQALYGKSKNIAPRCPAVTAETRQNPVRKVFGVTSKGNISGSTVAGRPFWGSGRNLNPELTRICTGGPRLNPASLVKKQSIAKAQTSDKAPLDAARTSKPNSKLQSSNAAPSGQMSSASVRMSLGPFVKTRTGLIPAVTQPSNAKPNVTRTSATAAHTNATASTHVAKMVQAKSAPSRFVSRAVLPVYSATRRDETQGQKLAKSKPPPGKHSWTFKNNQSLQGPKSTSSCASTSTAAPLKSQGNVGTKTFAGQPADKTAKPKSASEGAKIGQPSKAAPQMSSKPANGCRSRPSREPRASAPPRKTETSSVADSKKEKSSAQVHPRQRRTTAPVLSQTVPPPARTISFTGHASSSRTTKVAVRIVPQTEGKKLSAAQEERLRKLQEWREARGISYKRPPMPVSVPVRRTFSVSQPFWESMKKEDEAHSLMCAVDRSLADCIKLLGEGCPPEQVRGVLSRLPSLSQKFAKYWICRARLMELEGDLNVLPMFEEAVRVVLEPVDELREVVFEILKKKDEAKVCAEQEEGDPAAAAKSTPERHDDPMMTPKPVRALIWGHKGDSSLIKYKITATPGGPASAKREPARVNGQDIRFFTPVRRSVRIERASLRYPAALLHHDPCVASYEDLFPEEDAGEERKVATKKSPSEGDAPLYVYRENEALEDKVIVQLVCEDTA